MALSRASRKDSTGFRAVKAEILRRILNDNWGPGHMLPGEIDLARQFAVARGTVNRALTELTDEGYLDRRRKAGTVVRQAPLRAARFQIPLVREEIEAKNARYGYRLLRRSVESGPEDLRRHLGLIGGTEALHLQCLHLADDVAYQFEDRWISLAALPAAREADFADTGPNEWLVRTVPFSEVEISFSALAASAAVARGLEIEKDVPVFTAERTTWWKGKALTHVQLSYRPGYKLTTRY